MSMYKGNNELSDLNFGNINIGQLYKGNTLLWEKNSGGSISWIQSEPIVFENLLTNRHSENIITEDFILTNYGFTPSETSTTIYMDFVSPGITINNNGQLTYIPGLVVRHVSHTTAIYPSSSFSYTFKYEIYRGKFSVDTIVSDPYSLGLLTMTIRYDVTNGLTVNEIAKEHGTVYAQSLTTYSTNPGSSWDGTSTGYGAPIAANTDCITVANGYFRLYE